VNEERTTKGQLAGTALVTVRPTTNNDKEWIARVITQWWGSTDVVTRGKLLSVTTLPGFLAVKKGKAVGVVTYTITNMECEIVTLNSLRPRKGIGVRLVDEVKKVARSAQCARLVVITTNDNMRALQFYQHNGFTLVAVHRNALEQARRLKKEIPLFGQNGIQLRDELELELIL
jgi:N-acetylglutamate synthase-like GNAT family acetyltransferase